MSSPVQFNSAQFRLIVGIFSGHYSVNNEFQSFVPKSVLQFFTKRMKVASATEKAALQKLYPGYMSDEEDGVDDQSLPGLWDVTMISPPWRSSQRSLSRLEEDGGCGEVNLWG